jgi:hypothetical protein
VAKRQPGPRPEPRDFYPAPATEGVAPDLAATSPDNGAEDQAGALNFTRDITEHEINLLLHLAAQMQARFPDGAPHFTEEQMRQISGRMVFAYPTNWTIVEIGPAFDTRSLAEFWSVSPAQVRRRVAAGTVFALKIRGRYLYPDFQLDPVGRVSRRFFDLVALVRPTFTDDVELATWLSTWPSQPSPARLVSIGKIDEAFERAAQLLDRYGATSSTEERSL